MILSMIAAPSSHAQIVLADPVNFSVKRTFTAMQLGVPADLGGLHFSADGSTLYVVGGAVLPSSAVYAIPVIRDAGTDEVTGFGAATLAFAGTSAGIDAGIATGPSGTLFYGYWGNTTQNLLAQRPGGVGGAESLFDLTTIGLPSGAASSMPSWIDGITFSPFRTDPMTGFGRLQVSIWDSDFDDKPETGPRRIYDIDLSPAGGGLFTPTAATPFVTLPIGTELEPIGSATGMDYVPAGPFKNSLMYASWNVGQVRYIAIDEATGLPFDAVTQQPTLGTTTPIDTLFASNLEMGPLGIEFDPLTDDLFLTTSQGFPLNTLFQIGGFVGGPVTTTTVTSTTQPAVTTTTQVGATTTTTTLPAGCEVAATFASILCRLDELAGGVQALGDVGPAGMKLTGKLQSARTRTASAEAAAAAGQRKPAKAALKKAVRQVNGFRKVLRGRAAAGIPESTRTTLGNEGLALRDALRALRGTI